MTPSDGVPKRFSRDPSSWPKWMQNGQRENCHDCGVAIGEAHEEDCDDAICLWTGERRSECRPGLAARARRALVKVGERSLAEEVSVFLDLDDPEHDCGLDVWDGTFPGERDMAALRLFIRWTDQGWEECLEDAPGAQPDLNSLVWCEWDRAEARWVPRKTGDRS